MLKNKTLRRILALVCVIAMTAGCIGCGTKKGGDRDTKNQGSDKQTNTAVTPTETPATPTETPATPTPTQGQSEQGSSKNLTAGSSGQPAKTRDMDETMRNAYEAFAYKMFNSINAGETRMISPFSIYTVLAMFANGADGNTLAEIDELLGLTDEERNAYLATWIARLTEQKEGATRFTNADSVWIRDVLGEYVPKAFLDTCAQYYKAAVFSAKMNDETVRDVNSWVDKNTMGMIKELIKELSPDVAMILMNAIALDAKWLAPFNEERIQEDYDFTKTDGTKKKVEMMFDDLSHGYLENELATGFTKVYEGGEFSYVALLPKEGVSLEQLIASLQPGSVSSLLNRARSGEIIIGLPKYTEEYEMDLNDVLKGLGMKEAFDPYGANLKRLLDRDGLNAYVSKVIHKTYISVDDKGTKAAAVTAIIADVATAVGPSEVYRVVLDRPFVYFIVDSEGLPIFMGTYEG